MRLLAFLAGPLAMAALVLVFGWPALFACFALAWATFLFSTGDSEAGVSPMVVAAESSQSGRRGHPAAFARSGHAVMTGVGSIDAMDAEL